MHREAGGAVQQKLMSVIIGDDDADIGLHRFEFVANATEEGLSPGRPHRGLPNRGGSTVEGHEWCKHPQ